MFYSSFSELLLISSVNISGVGNFLFVVYSRNDYSQDEPTCQDRQLLPLFVVELKEMWDIENCD